MGRGQQRFVRQRRTGRALTRPQPGSPAFRAARGRRTRGRKNAVQAEAVQEELAVQAEVRAMSDADRDGLPLPEYDQAGPVRPPLPGYDVRVGSQVPRGSGRPSPSVVTHEHFTAAALPVRPRPPRSCPGSGASSGRCSTPSPCCRAAPWRSARSPWGARTPGARSCEPAPDPRKSDGTAPARQGAGYGARRSGGTAGRSRSSWPPASSWPWPRARCTASWTAGPMTPRGAARAAREPGSRTSPQPCPPDARRRARFTASRPCTTRRAESPLGAADGPRVRAGRDPVRRRLRPATAMTRSEWPTRRRRRGVEGRRPPQPRTAGAFSRPSARTREARGNGPAPVRRRPARPPGRPRRTPRPQPRRAPPPVRGRPGRR